MTSIDSPFDRLVRLMAADPALPDYPSACRRLRVTPGAKMISFASLVTLNKAKTK